MKKILQLFVFSLLSVFTTVEHALAAEASQSKYRRTRQVVPTQTPITMVGAEAASTGDGTGATSPTSSSSGVLSPSDIAAFPRDSRGRNRGFVSPVVQPPNPRSGTRSAAVSPDMEVLAPGVAIEIDSATTSQPTVDRSSAVSPSSSTVTTTSGIGRLISAVKNLWARASSRSVKRTIAITPVDYTTETAGYRTPSPTPAPGDGTAAIIAIAAPRSTTPPNSTLRRPSAMHATPPRGYATATSSPERPATVDSTSLLLHAEKTSSFHAPNSIDTGPGRASMRVLDFNENEKDKDARARKRTHKLKQTRRDHETGGAAGDEDPTAFLLHMPIKPIPVITTPANRLLPLQRNPVPGTAIEAGGGGGGEGGFDGVHHWGTVDNVMTVQPARLPAPTPTEEVVEVDSECLICMESIPLNKAHAYLHPNQGASLHKCCADCILETQITEMQTAAKWDDRGARQAEKLLSIFKDESATDEQLMELNGFRSSYQMACPTCRTPCIPIYDKSIALTKATENTNPYPLKQLLKIMDTVPAENKTKIIFASLLNAIQSNRAIEIITPLLNAYKNMSVRTDSIQALLGRVITTSKNQKVFAAIYNTFKNHPDIENIKLIILTFARKKLQQIKDVEDQQKIGQIISLLNELEDGADDE